MLSALCTLVKNKLKIFDSPLLGETAILTPSSCLKDRKAPFSPLYFTYQVEKGRILPKAVESNGQTAWTHVEILGSWPTFRHFRMKCLLFCLFCDDRDQIQGLVHSRQVPPPLSIHILSISDVSKRELLQAFQVTASPGSGSLVPPGHRGDDGLGSRICTQAGEGTRDPLFWLDRSHPRTFL